MERNGSGREKKGEGGAVIWLTGNRSAVVDGCDGILDYDSGKVILRTGRLTVTFSGEALQLRRLTENSAVIEGALTAVTYSR